ncbi:hypothetical protein BC940DRAFT_370458 [Gongronella butleri]|nr:hypothetical protein BC940DRAFT_370458 [Gongronella butleri]
MALAILWVIAFIVHELDPTFFGSLATLPIALTAHKSVNAVANVTTTLKNGLAISNSNPAAYLDITMNNTTFMLKAADTRGAKGNTMATDFNGLWRQFAWYALWPLLNSHTIIIYTAALFHTTIVACIVWFFLWLFLLMVSVLTAVALIAYIRHSRLKNHQEIRLIDNTSDTPRAAIATSEIAKDAQVMLPPASNLGRTASHVGPSPIVTHANANIDARADTLARQRANLHNLKLLRTKLAADLERLQQEAMVIEAEAIQLRRNETILDEQQRALDVLEARIDAQLKQQEQQQAPFLALIAELVHRRARLVAQMREQEVKQIAMYHEAADLEHSIAEYKNKEPQRVAMIQSQKRALDQVVYESTVKRAAYDLSMQWLRVAANEQRIVQKSSLAPKPLQYGLLNASTSQIPPHFTAPTLHQQHPPPLAITSAPLHPSVTAPIQQNSSFAFAAPQQKRFIVPLQSHHHFFSSEMPPWQKIYLMNNPGISSSSKSSTPAPMASLNLQMSLPAQALPSPSQPPTSNS